jgi:hypothetical protein
LISFHISGFSDRLTRKGFCMVRPEVVRKRLNKIDERLAVLQRLQRYGRDEFLSNPERGTIRLRLTDEHHQNSQN